MTCRARLRPGFLEICCHASYGVDFKVCVATAAELFGSLKRC